MTYGLVLVSYYLRSVAAVRELLDAFDADVERHHGQVLVIDNAGVLPVGAVVDDRRKIFVVRGSNQWWEFSGWLEGLGLVKDWPSSMVLTLLNDSYARNWTITSASRPIIFSMYDAAEKGRIACWLDNFSLFRRPVFSRRLNSRLLLVPAQWRDIVAQSLTDAIHHCSSRHGEPTVLFTAAELSRLRAWMSSQANRWDPKTLPSRLQRIFLEHHMLDSVPQELVAAEPATYVGTLVYAIGRRLLSERR